MADLQRVREVLSQLTGALVGPFGLGEVIAQLSADMSEILGVKGAGLMVEDEQGDMRFVSTSDEVLARLEELQIRYDEGPCLQAYRTGERVFVPDLADAMDRFPRFAPDACASGMRAVFSFPVAVRETVVGALNLYQVEPCTIADEDAEIGLMLAQMAAIYLLHAQDVDHLRRNLRKVRETIDGRAAVEQAKGFVAARRGVSADDAFHMLRRHARRQREPLHRVAQQVVDRAIPVRALPRPIADARPETAGQGRRAS